jgi:hypothetical protein
MGNRSRRELEGAAILRDMLAHPPREKPHPPCDLCGEPAVIGAYTWHRAHHFCAAHRAKADRVFDRVDFRRGD